MTRRFFRSRRPFVGAGLLSWMRTNMKAAVHDARILGGWLAVCVVGGSAVTLAVQAPG